MRRQVLPYVADYVREYHAVNGGKDGAGLNVLDVASGTGRFLAFMRDNWRRPTLQRWAEPALPRSHARFEQAVRRLER